MKDIYEVLQQKEADIERLTWELQALRVVAPLLEEELAPEELAPEVQVVSSSARTYPTPPAQPGNGGPTATKPIWSWGRLTLKRAPRSAA